MLFLKVKYGHILCYKILYVSMPDREDGAVKLGKQTNNNNNKNLQDLQVFVVKRKLGGSFYSSVDSEKHLKNIVFKEERIILNCTTLYYCINETY